MMKGIRGWMVGSLALLVLQVPSIEARVQGGDCMENFWSRYQERIPPTPYPTISACIANPDCTNFLINGHRGTMLFAPEDTLSAFEFAIKAGVDIVELDVRTTKDGYLVLMHDDTVNRTTNGRGEVAEMTLAQIEALTIRAKNPCIEDEHVPTFEEALRFLKGRVAVDVDVKDATPEAIVAALRDTEMLDQAFVQAKSIEKGIAFRTLEPAIHLLGKADTVEEVEAVSEAFSPVVIEIHSYAPSPELVAAIHERGARVLLYAGGYLDLVGRAGYRFVYERGVDILQSDRPFAAVSFARSTWDTPGLTPKAERTRLLP
ncbi:MAG: hypothetical protein D6795_12370 [Deltaproteobacteria bacterium]|nr:MAG: hypothetical protein D6795_12370 [Deltaproteobacteria bacterium]